MDRAGGPYSLEPSFVITYTNTQHLYNSISRIILVVHTSCMFIQFTTYVSYDWVESSMYFAIILEASLCCVQHISRRDHLPKALLQNGTASGRKKAANATV